MALESYSLTTVAAVKAHLDISVSTWDTVIEDMIDATTDMIESYCGGRRFKASGSDVTEYYDGDVLRDGKNILALKSYPIISITSVSYSSGDYNNPTWTAYDPATYYIKNSARGLLYMNALPYEHQALRVVYQAGYATIPNDLALACIMWVARIFNRRKSGDATNESVGGASVGWNAEMPLEVKQILANYRDYVV